MKQWTTVDRTVTPNGKTITLDQHDGDYSIRVDGATLMMTRMHYSEEKAAEMACAHVKGKKGVRVLIGGLGFGFTLKAALAAVGRDARVTVAEILEAVIAWNRNPALPLAADALADPRTVVAHRDVTALIRESRREFDAIVLDVDNGPAAVTADDNGRLYTGTGLRSVYAALRPGGCVAFWSAGPDEPFERAMRNAGFRVEVKTVRAHPNGGRRHTIFLGRAPEA
jgi:spermidine synthase